MGTSKKRGGARRDRTVDLLHAMQALSQLSYSPTRGARKYGTTRGMSRTYLATRSYSRPTDYGPSTNKLSRGRDILQPRCLRVLLAPGRYGIPVARRGRKASGLDLNPGSKIAGLPAHAV